MPGRPSPEVMPTLLTPRRWQKQLQKGTLKRNSRALKPAIWFFQRIKLREIRDQQSEGRFRRFALRALE